MMISQQCHKLSVIILADLIKYSSTGYYGDYFIKMSSFSFGLSEGEESLEKSLEALKESSASL